MKAFAFTDGAFGNALHPDSAGAGWELLFYHDGVWERESRARPLGSLASHEEAEYRAALLCLRRAREIGVSYCLLRTDSKLLPDQINGHAPVEDDEIRGLWEELHQLRSEFRNLNFLHVSRTYNATAIGLAEWAVLQNCRPSSALPR